MWALNIKFKFNIIGKRTTNQVRSSYVRSYVTILCVALRGPARLLPSSCIDLHIARATLTFGGSSIWSSAVPSNLQLVPHYLKF